MGIERVHYRERQRLTAGDLAAEQAYRLGMAGRHHLGPHDWGVVRGLAVVEAEDTSYQLMAGVAVDGYGRELLVPEPVELDVPEGSGPRFVVLYHCEDPVAASGWPASRVRQRTAVRVQDTQPQRPALSVDPGQARAAGALPQWPAWPVLVAVIAGEGNVLTELPAGESRVRWLRHRAGGVRTPAGQAELQLGLTGLRDLHHFLVSTRGAGGALQPRLGIDRDGVLHVWQTLAISGTLGEAGMEIQPGLSLVMRFPVPNSAGALRLEGRIGPKLDLSAVRLVGQGLPVTGLAVPLPAKSPSGHWGASALWLSRDKQRLLTLDEAHRRLSSPKLSSVQVIEAHVVRAGGTLRLGKPDTAPVGQQGDAKETRGGMLLLRPDAASEEAPSLRSVSAVDVTGPGTAAPATELRLSGGAVDEGGASVRLSMGYRDPKGFKAVLQMDAGRRIFVDSPLKAQGTVHLPPVGRNDPLLQDMLSFAYLWALARQGAVADGVQIRLEPDTTDSYKMLMGGLRATQAVVEQALEVIAFDNGSGQVSLRRLPTMVTQPSGTGQGLRVSPQGGTQDPPAAVSIDVPGLNGRPAIVQVLLLLRQDKAACVAVSQRLALRR